VAAVYGCHISDFGMKPWQKPVENALGVLEGTVKKQESFDFYESDRHEYVTGFEGYCNDEKVNWVNGRGEEKIEISGRYGSDRGCGYCRAGSFGGGTRRKSDQPV
jgi:hypothetical protein